MGWSCLDVRLFLVNYVLSFLFLMNIDKVEFFS